MRFEAWIIYITQYLICAASMVLTALFAFSFSTPDQSLSWSTIELSAILMIGIGVGIDLSKYLFWRHRSDHLGYLILSLVLVAFSCAASMAFFVGHERDGVESARKESVTYKTHKANIDLLQREIETTQSITDNRLSSRFHDQWEKGDVAIDVLSEKRNELVRLMKDSRDIGLDEAKQYLSTAAFFVSISKVINQSSESVVVIAFGILALIIEASALGMNSLSKKYRFTKNDSECPQHVTKKVTDPELIKREILNGATPPMVRKIIEKYTVRHSEASKLLNDLVNDNKLERTGTVYKKFKLIRENKSVVSV